MLLSLSGPPLDFVDEKWCSQLQDCPYNFKEYHRVGQRVNYDSTLKAKKRKKNCWVQAFPSQIVAHFLLATSF